MFGKIWSGIKNFGSNTFENLGDYFKGKAEDAINIFNTAGEFLSDAKDVGVSIFTGGDTQGEINNLVENLKDNTSEIIVDNAANLFNDVSIFVRTRTDLIQDGANVLDDIYNPEEDNFKSLDGFLEKANNVEDLVCSAHDNIDPLKNFLGNVFSIVGSQITKENIGIAIGEAQKEGDLFNQFKTFNMSLLEKTAINIVNDAINSKPTGTIADSEISNTHEYNNLTNKDMLLLNNLSYSGFANIENKGKTLGEITDELKDKIRETGVENAFDENGNVTTEGVLALAKTKYLVGTDDFELFANILNEISNKEELASLTILDNTDIPENGISATTYGRLDENGKLIENATVVFQGTIGNEGWQDNAKSLNETTKMQKAAYEYIERQEYVLKDISKNPDDIHLTVSGHSKGGNFAMFSTIENSKDSSSNIVIDNCLSFNGEGFNDEFVTENKEVIEANKSKITSINSYVDPVNLLLNDISGETYFVGVDYTKIKIDENGNAVINESEDYTRFVFDAHYPQCMYKEVNNSEKGEWTLYEKSEIAASIDNISDDVEDMNEPIKSHIVNKLVAMFDEGNTAKEVEQAEYLCDIDKYNLIITRTKDGYNVCDKDSGNIVAKYDENANLISGCIGQYATDSEESLHSEILNNIQASK